MPSAMEPVFSAITAAFKLAEYGLKVADAGEDKRLFCALIERVRKDRAEALRERRDKAAALKRRPAKKAWIDGAIADTEHALVEIGKLVEPGRMQGADGGGARELSLQQRVAWVLLKKDTLLTKQALLAFCHQTLSTAIVFMQDLPAEEGEGEGKAEGAGEEGVARTVTEPPPSYAAALRSPWARRPGPKKSFSDSATTWLHGEYEFEQSFSGKSSVCSSVANVLTISTEEIERMLSDSASISSSQPPQPQWDDMSDIGTLNVGDEAMTTLHADGWTSAPELDKARAMSDPTDRQSNLSVPNPRRRRFQARFEGGG